MWRLLGILALVICSEAMPKKYAGIHLRKPASSRASSAAKQLDSNLVQPNNYKLGLTVTDDNLNNATFSGIVDISLDVFVETESFVLHASKDITINEISLVNDGTDIPITNETNNSDDFLTIKSADGKFQTGNKSILHIVYTGKLSDTDMEGLYRSNYTDDGNNLKYLATTQFEQMGARRAFPCFDEPFFKATFDISITYSDGYNALSNTAPDGEIEDINDGLKKVTFKQTPKMSTYLVAFIVSEFACKNGTDDTLPTSVCARNGTEDDMAVALETAPQALNKMKDFTNLSYQKLGNEKMTQVAIPDFAAGAMENWGLVTYREADLLWNENESSNYYKQAVVTVITHELSHQWFGDYVTLNWWSNTFLNEGFATYFEYHAAAEIQDKWELEKQFVTEQVQPVLVTDSSIESKPLSYNVSDPEEIENRFDDISYNKGGTVLKMLQSFLGIENFKKGLTTYIRLRAGDVATPEDLWKSFNDFRPADVTDLVEKIMNNWTFKPGYPLLTLTQDGVNVKITQERFLLTGTDEEKTKWYVPITYTTSKNTSKFAETATQNWLKPDDENFNITLDSEDDWIILNNQQVGYYRVKYDDVLLQKIKTDLNKDNFGNIDEISRSQLVDDLLNLARANQAEYTDVLKFLAFLKKDTSYYSWSSAFNGFSYLLKRTSSNEIRNLLKSYIKELMKTLVSDVPFTTEKNDDQIYTLRQVLALTWACNMGDSTCVEDATKKFADYTSTGNAISPNLRSIVYCNGLRNSNNGAAEFDFLYGKYTSTKLATEQVTILKALGCINNSTIRQDYLKKALTQDVRLQDARYVFQSVYSNNEDEGVTDMLEFISNNYEGFEPHFGSQSTLTSLVSTVADLITTQDQLEKLRYFVNTEGLDDSIKTAAENAVSLATTNLNTITTLEGKLKEYFSVNSASINTYHLVNLAFIGVVYLIFNFY